MRLDTRHIDDEFGVDPYEQGWEDGLHKTSVITIGSRLKVESYSDDKVRIEYEQMLARLNEDQKVAAYAVNRNRPDIFQMREALAWQQIFSDINAGGMADVAEPREPSPIDSMTEDEVIAYIEKNDQAHRAASTTQVIDIKSLLPATASDQLQRMLNLKH